MTKTSIVTDVKSAGQPYQGQYGTLYGFYVTFQNGDNGKYNSKSADQTKFVVGQEATYEYIPREYQGKTYYTVKPVNPEYANNGSAGQSKPSYGASAGSGNRDEAIIRQTALKAAAELGGTPQEVMQVAQMFADWVMKKDSAVATTTHEQHFAGRQQQPQYRDTPAEVAPDGLPF